MEITAALVKEQGITFAVVLVKPHVVNSPSESGDLIQQLYTIRDFHNIPVTLAAQSGGRALYRGRNDIVNFLKRFPLSALPWKTYRLS